MRRRTSIILGVLVIGTLAGAPGILPALAQAPPGKDELAKISERGKKLTAYDQAAWHGGDAFETLNPDRSQVTHYLAQERGDGTWRVVFGKRSDTGDAFLIAYESSQSAVGGPFVATARQPAIQDGDFFLRASRAVDAAREAFGNVDRPYNLAVLPQPDGQWFVYEFPAATKADAWPLGADTRFTVTADGRTITETRRLHKTVLETPSTVSEGGKVAAHFHIHVLACIPEDTDVLAVLSREPKAPEYIVCDPFSFAVDPDGTVRFIGHSKELWGDPKEKK
jgi:hypothetical protein